jgi:hypothetical protein
MDLRIKNNEELKFKWDCEKTNASGSQAHSYYMPSRLNDRNNMRDFIRLKIPEEDRIEIFGLHETSSNKSKMETAYELIGRVVRHQFILPVPHSEILKIGKEY